MSFCPIAPEIKGLIPDQLLRALEIADQQLDSVLIKKTFAKNKGQFFSFKDGCAKVKINLPLHYHSLVLEFSQKKHSSAVEVRAYWKSYDRSHAHYLEPLKVFASLTGLCLKGFEVTDKDLHVAFISQNEEQISLISQAIASTFSDIYRSSYNPLDAVIKLMATFRKTEDLDLVKEEIMAQILEQYANGGDLPHFISKYEYKEYFSNHPMSMELKEKVISELEKTSPEKRDLKKPYQCLIPFALTGLPEEKRYQVVWKDLNGAQNLSHSEVAKWGGLEIFNRLIEENPTKAAAYYSFYQDDIDKKHGYSMQNADKKALYRPIKERFKSFYASILKDVIEKGTVTLSLASVSKKQLEQLTEAELEKVIWADLKSAQSIPIREYPETVYPILKRFFDECRAEAIAYVLKIPYSYFIPPLFYAFMSEYGDKNPDFIKQVKEGGP